MDARRFLRLIAFVSVLFCSHNLYAATAATTNFVVHAPTKDFANEVAQEAERFRRELSIAWLGKEMPRWGKRCPIKVRVSEKLGAGGATTFSFHNGEVFGWKMSVQGSKKRILDSVIPHEITHTILACHFRKPLPRWADEGISTLIEHSSEQQVQVNLLKTATRENRRIPLRRLFAITEYPANRGDIMTLYAEGYAVSDFLVQQGGRKKFLAFLGDAMKANWDAALKKHYRITSIEKLEAKWDDWLVAGRPSLQLPPNTALAERTTSPARRIATAVPSSNELRGRLTSLPPLPPTTIIRGQAPDRSREVIPLVAKIPSANSASPQRKRKPRAEGLVYPIYRQTTSRK